MRLARISCLELARTAYPAITSGAGQAYLSRLDKVFQPDGFRAKVEPRPVTGFRVMSLDESQVFNVTDSELRQVVRKWI